MKVKCSCFSHFYIFYYILHIQRYEQSFVSTFIHQLCHYQKLLTFNDNNLVGHSKNMFVLSFFNYEISVWIHWMSMFTPKNLQKQFLDNKSFPSLHILNFWFSICLLELGTFWQFWLGYCIFFTSTNRWYLNHVYSIHSRWTLFKSSLIIQLPKLLGSFQFRSLHRQISKTSSFRCTYPPSSIRLILQC